jgi:hypothetical protein
MTGGLGRRPLHGLRITTRFPASPPIMVGCSGSDDAHSLKEDKAGSSRTGGAGRAERRGHAGDRARRDPLKQWVALLDVMAIPHSPFGLVARLSAKHKRAQVKRYINMLGRGFFPHMSGEGQLKYTRACVLMRVYTRIKYGFSGIQ